MLTLIAIAGVVKLYRKHKAKQQRRFIKSVRMIMIENHKKKRCSWFNKHKRKIKIDNHTRGKTSIYKRILNERERKYNRHSN